MSPRRPDHAGDHGGADARPAAVCGDRRRLLVLVAGLGAVTAEAVATLQRSSAASARGRLAATERAGLTRSWRPVRGLATLHTITPRGLSEAGIGGISPGRVSPGGARHAAAAALTAAALASAFPDHDVLGEPALRRRERERGRPLATLAAMQSAGGLALERTGAAPPGHRPDLLLLARGASGTGTAALPTAVEVELTVKAPARLAAICRAWARSREVSGVIYLAEGPVLAPLARAVAETGAGSRIAVLPLGAFGEAIAVAP